MRSAAGQAHGPTIAGKFNTYRIADYKEKVIDLLAVSTVRGMETAAR